MEPWETATIVLAVMLVLVGFVLFLFDRYGNK